MGQFRKKPVVIEAMQFVGGPDSAATVQAWMGNEAGRHIYDIDMDCLVIHTLEGKMDARVGDWIIRGVKGELYPCKPDIFDATYEAI